MSKRAPIPPPPPADADILHATWGAGLLCISLAKFRRLRRADPTFPEPRRIGEELRWRRGELLAWYELQPRGWSQIGGRNVRPGVPGRKVPPIVAE